MIVALSEQHAHRPHDPAMNDRLMVAFYWLAAGSVSLVIAAGVATIGPGSASTIMEDGAVATLVALTLAGVWSGWWSFRQTIAARGRRGRTGFSSLETKLLAGIAATIVLLVGVRTVLDGQNVNSGSPTTTESTALIVAFCIGIVLTACSLNWCVWRSPDSGTMSGLALLVALLIEISVLKSTFEGPDAVYATAVAIWFAYFIAASYHQRLVDHHLLESATPTRSAVTYTWRTVTNTLFLRPGRLDRRLVSPVSLTGAKLPAWLIFFATTATLAFARLSDLTIAIRIDGLIDDVGTPASRAVALAITPIVYALLPGTSSAPRFPSSTLSRAATAFSVVWISWATIA